MRKLSQKGYLWTEWCQGRAGKGAKSYSVSPARTMSIVNPAADANPSAKHRPGTCAKTYREERCPAQRRLGCPIQAEAPRRSPNIGIATKNEEGMCKSLEYMEGKSGREFGMRLDVLVQLQTISGL
ncbi:hypothetical protein K438DRAFT_1756114 [Mycena galopus ATCC 62051]|nr:hypothetical protein K438DRAFT_1756114 [Mycena galopus ATCC 62051]